MGTATILVVDEERKVREVVRSYRELEGYTLFVADSGERALESASRSDPTSWAILGSPTSRVRRSLERSGRHPTSRSSFSPPHGLHGALTPRPCGRGEGGVER